MLVGRNRLEQEKEWMAWEGWGQFWEWRERVSSFERGVRAFAPLSFTPGSLIFLLPTTQLLASLCFLESLFKWASLKSSKCMWHWLKGTRISCRKPFEKKNATIGSEVPTCLIFDSELLRIVSRLFICWTLHNMHPKYQRFISLTPKLTRQLQLQHSTEDRAFASQGLVG